MSLLLKADGPKKIAYFTMEIGLKDEIPTYSGGLGILAGDTIKSFADLELDSLAVTLLYRKGYFKQSIDEQGRQNEEPVAWNVEEFMQPTPYRMLVRIENRDVQVRAWRCDVLGATGHIVPVYYLDTDLVENSKQDRTLTDHLYGGDNHYRLAQEIVLGVGGTQLIQQLSEEPAQKNKSWRFHMNEGHAALLTLGLAQSSSKDPKDFMRSGGADKLKKVCVFTTHTPVPAGHDKFLLEDAVRILGKDEVAAMEILGGVKDGYLNMTYVALSSSGFVNGVAKRHGEVSRAMFATNDITSITNGIHARTWLCPEMAELFDRHVPAWRKDNAHIRQLCEVPLDEIKEAHLKAKNRLFRHVKKETGVEMDPAIFTIGFARRAATYKRADLIFDRIEELNELAEKHSGLQLLYSGKAHPKDDGGKQLIQNVIANSKRLSSKVKFVYLPNYNMKIGGLLTSGVDLWLNNPIKPLEASGTSGMKASLNGVPNLSTLDGWWVEGYVKGVTGWEIEDEHDGMSKGVGESSTTRELARKSLFEVLNLEILPKYYKKEDEYLEVMRHNMSLNGSYFNTQRMVQQYIQNAYTASDATNIR